MRVLLLAGLSIAAAAALALPAAGAGDRPARLLLVKHAPLVLGGIRFEPQERVRLTVLGARWTKVVRANAAGRFVVRLTDAPAAVCGKRWLRATGALGSLSAKAFWLGACAPAGAPDPCVVSPIVRDPVTDRRNCVPPPGAQISP
jgi:hypothetical protein